MMAFCFDYIEVTRQLRKSLLNFAAGVGAMGIATFFHP
jgi:hypothetical protein